MDSFNPNILCPHCGAHNTPSVTGFGRTGLNVRAHACATCRQEYNVLVVVEASACDTPTDMALAGLRSRIAWMKKRISMREAQLITKADGLALELVRVEASTCGNQN